jgi:hypothetical protein
VSTESRPRRRRPTPVLLAVAVAGALLVPLSGPAMAAPSDLNAPPEDQDRAVGVNATVTGTIEAPQADPTVLNFSWDGDGTFEEQCTIAPNVETRCNRSYTSLEIGVDEVRVWVDGLPVDTTEGPRTPDGATPDTTDVVTVGWFVEVPGTLNCSPERRSVGPGEDANFDCALSSGTAGALIDGENMSGPNDPEPVNADTADYDDACVTDADGSCRVTIDGSDGDTGSARLCFWVDEEDDDSYHPNGDPRERDGNFCASEPSAPDQANLTDVVVAGWGEARSATVVAPSIKKFGARFSVTGTVNSGDTQCEAGVQVRIQRDVLGSPTRFVNWKSDTTSGSGAYSVTAKADKSANYRAALSDADPCLATTSKAKTVRVSKKLTINAPKAVGRGQIARITGKIAPCQSHKGDRVALLRKKGGRFRKVATDKSNNKCLAAFSVRIKRTSVFKVRAGKTEPWLQAGASRPKKVRAR